MGSRLRTILMGRYCSEFKIANWSLLSMKSDLMIIQRHGKQWRDSSHPEKYGQLVLSLHACLTCIGVSNFNVSQLKKLLKTAKIQPAVHQIEIHPFPPASKKCLMSRWLTQPELHKFCRDHNILLTAYSPLGGQHPGGHAKHGGQSPLKDETVCPFVMAGSLTTRSSRLQRR